MEVRPYQPQMAEAWNAFNRRARNGHFLFDRGYMDYHADRFADASLVALQDGAPVALLPANRAGDTVWSHQGLTFGGLVIEALGAAEVLTLLDQCAEAWRGQGATSLVYKPMPVVYPRRPAQEDLYWLFRRDARLIRRDVTASIDYRAPGPTSSRRTRGARKADKAGLSYQRSHRWADYWGLLETVLAARHAVGPVHSPQEIALLADRFPDHIALHTAERAGEILAGVVIFLTPEVAHAQYIAVGEAGREVAALDGLVERLIEQFRPTHRYFDFGVSNTDQGRVLNEGLMRQKEEFGASAVAHDVYRLDGLG